MWCGKCNNDVMDCDCDDLVERMVSASDNPYVALKWCITCDLYYARCKCDEPKWGIRTDGAVITDPVILKRFGL